MRTKNHSLVFSRQIIIYTHRGLQPSNYHRNVQHDFLDIRFGIIKFIKVKNAEHFVNIIGKMIYEKKIVNKNKRTQFKKEAWSGTLKAIKRRRR